MSDKSNVMTFAGGLWQRVFKLVAAEYPEIQTQHMYVDALCMHMVRDPKQFDVIVTNNMFGDIITDLAAALQGGLGMAASGNIHPGKTSMFEPVHGSAPPFAGKNIANPIGAISTAAMMLEHLGFAAEAEQINQPCSPPCSRRRPRRMLAGLGTKEAAEWIANALSRREQIGLARAISRVGAAAGGFDASQIYRRMHAYGQLFLSLLSRRKTGRRK